MAFDARIVLFTIAVLVAYVRAERISSAQHAAEKQALIDLYNATDGENWQNKCSWTANISADVDHCEWCGIILRQARPSRRSPGSEFGVWKLLPNQLAQCTG